MIKPSVGRVVWYRPAGATHLPPHAALITHVWSDVCVNLAVFDAEGKPYARTSVPLAQADGAPPVGSFAEWMPYQLGQAAKTEALQNELAEATAGR